jgi:hypothetical protein
LNASRFNGEELIVMATEAQIEANRRNSQKSTGPRTDEGKNRSRHNALDHGCRANLLNLPTEVFGEYERHSLAWKRSIGPRNPSEEALIDRILRLDLQSKRIDRAQTARLTKRMHCGFLEEDNKQQRKVIELGQKLFHDSRGPRALQLERQPGEPLGDGEPVRISDYSLTEDHPMRLVNDLEATGAGCEWLLEQWAALRGLLERDIPWLAPDKLKAVRLLGRHPIDAIDAEDVAGVYLASHVLLNEGGAPFQEVLNELPPDQLPRYEKYLKRRRYDTLAPKDADAARQMLREIVNRAVMVLEDKAGAYRELDEINAQTAGNRLSWDDTPEGERLRRYELTCQRAWLRMFELLLKVRRTGEELDFATSGLPGGSAPAANPDAIDTPAPPVANVITRPEEPVKMPDPPNEANSERENAPNEANSSVPAPSPERRDERKEFRIDTPHPERKSAAMGISRKEEGSRVLPELDFGRRSPLLNLAPIFGKQ